MKLWYGFKPSTLALVVGTLSAFSYAAMAEKAVGQQTVGGVSETGQELMANGHRLFFNNFDDIEYVTDNNAEGTHLLNQMEAEVKATFRGGKAVAHSSPGMYLSENASWVIEPAGSGENTGMGSVELSSPARWLRFYIRSVDANTLGTVKILDKEGFLLQETPATDIGSGEWTPVEFFALEGSPLAATISIENMGIGTIALDDFAFAALPVQREQHRETAQTVETGADIVYPSERVSTTPGTVSEVGRSSAKVAQSKVTDRNQGTEASRAAIKYEVAQTRATQKTQSYSASQTTASAGSAAGARAAATCPDIGFTYSVVAKSANVNSLQYAFDGKIDDNGAYFSEGYIQLDLCEQRVLDSIDLAFLNGDKNKQSPFEIQVLSGGKWQSLLQAKSSGKTNDLQHFDVNNTAVTAVRIMGNPQQGTWNNFTEIKPNFIAAPPSPESCSDLGFTYSVTAKSANVNSIKDAFDGKIDEKRAYFSEGYIQLDLCEQKTLTSLDLAFYKGDANKQNPFSIQVLNNSQWKTVLQAKSSGKTNAFQNFDVDDIAVTGIRIVGNPTPNSWNNFTEIRPNFGGNGGGQGEGKIYKVYYLGGQSNMIGMGMVNELPGALQKPNPANGVMIYHTPELIDGSEATGQGLWTKVKAGHGSGFWSNGNTNKYSERFGPELTFAMQMKQLHPNENIAIIKYAKGGSSIDSRSWGAEKYGFWDPDYNKPDNPNQYGHFLATVKKALSVKDIDGDGKADTLIPAGIVWMQGESDTNYLEVANAYEDNLRRLMGEFRSTFKKARLPIVIGRITDSGQAGDGTVYNHADIVRRAQANFVKKDVNAALVTSTDNYGYVDKHHYNTAGYIDLGKEFAKAMKGLEDADPGSGIPPVTANPNASKATASVLKYFYNLSASGKVLTGEYIGPQTSDLSSIEEIRQQTGEYLGMIGADYYKMKGSPPIYERPNKALISYWNAGGLVTLSLHISNPCSGGGVRVNSGGECAISAILDPSSKAHKAYMEHLDGIATGIQQLEDAGVVVLLRPFHEMNGRWFWWGANSTEDFIKLWRHMFNYFTKTKKLDNLLWIYSPDKYADVMPHYPGDKFVDMVGMDIYTDELDNRWVGKYKQLLATGKPFGLGEFGPQREQNNFDYTKLLNGIKKHYPKVSFFQTWSLGWSLSVNKNAKVLVNDPIMVNRRDISLPSQ